MRQKPAIKVILLTLISALLLSSCSKSVPATAIAISKTDVSSIAINPMEKIGSARIVALANGVAELVNAMGYHANLVGRDIASTTDDLADIPIVTSGHQVIPETIIALHPSIVIIDSATGPQSAITKIKSSGIRVVSVSQSWNMPDVYQKITEIGAALKAPKSAEVLAYKIEVTAAQNKITTMPDTKRPKVAFLYLRGTSAIYLVGGKGSGADFLINATSGTDVGAEVLAKPFNPLTAETIATLNPDIILVMIGGLESVGGLAGLKKLPGVAQTSAGKRGQVIAVDDSLLLSFGPRTPSLIDKLAAAIKGFS